MGLWFIVILVLASILIDSASLPTIKIPFIKKEISLSVLSERFPFKLGLDLQGGTELTLQTQMDKISEGSRDDALESARSVIERRVNAFGVSEASVVLAKVGSERRILVDLPGVKDASAAASLVGKTAQLDFREPPATMSSEMIEATKSGIPVAFLYKKTGLTGADLKRAQVVYGQAGSNANPQVSIEFNSDGAKKFQEITKRNVGKPLAIFLDNQLVSAPIVQAEIIGGNAVINGTFTAESAKALAIQLNAGALPVPIVILSQRSIAASLGQSSVNKSLLAGFIGLGIVMLYMASYYGLFGVMADVALVIYTLITLAVFKTGLFILPPVTLTLSGIAGFILSVGMAVDANILIFERIKEERRWGKEKRRALELGFSRAWSSIRDSNISSLITSLILFNFGSGLVKGFALTLGVGVLISMFTAVVITKSLLKFILR